jgi:AAA15 family ATPase/GTPase
MVLEFKVENFRSFNSPQVFSFVAETTKSKPNNVFEVALPKGASVRLLKSAVIYGANASGKSNFLRAFATLKRLVVHSDSYKIGKEIDAFEPFRLDRSSREKTTKLELTFLLKSEAENIKYRYAIEFNGKEIVAESLDFYPNGQISNLFKRKKNGGDYDEIDIGKALKKSGVPKLFLKNQLILSKFGSQPHEQLNPVYSFFNTMGVGHNLDDIGVADLLGRLSDILDKPENEPLKRKLTLFVSAADTKILDISIGGLNEREQKIVANLPYSDDYKDIIAKKKRILARHQVYENGQPAGFEDFGFQSDTSDGTTTMLVILALVITQLEKGGLVVFDELDNSLHPKISRFFIQLFHSLNVNKGNAQIVFSTHEPLLMDKDMFRSDQIWFTEKNQFGETELYSAQDFEDVREDIPFDKWYMAGKFGALPNIQESLLLAL